MSCSRGCCPTQRDHYRSIGISAHALPTKGAPVIAADRREARWNRDDDAYARLVKDGLQPPTTVGCGDLEQSADDKVAVETGGKFTKERVDRVADATGSDHWVLPV